MSLLESLLRLLGFRRDDGSKKIRGADLQYDLTISPLEESQGFSRTIRFQRPHCDARGSSARTRATEAVEHVEMPSGWSAAKPRKTGKPYHYIIKAAGKGGFGIPPDNAGDLYVTIRVTESA
jgi:hypothetical protein